MRCGVEDNRGDEVVAVVTRGAQRRRRHRTLIVASRAVLIALALAAVVGRLVAGDAGAGPTSGREEPLPAAPRAALDVPAAAALPRVRGTTATWGPVLRTTRARVAPSPGAPAVAHVGSRTPEGTTNILQIVGRRRDETGALWLRVRLAVLPNGTTGWVPRAAVGGLTLVRTRLVVSLRRRSATLLRSGRVILRVPIGVGRPGSRTPRGSFYVRNRLSRFAGRRYGPIAFGTSARSADLTDWPAGGYIGIHGTDRPDLIPGAVSHGCIRMRNDAIVRLAALMPIGTPVTVRS